MEGGRVEKCAFNADFIGGRDGRRRAVVVPFDTYHHVVDFSIFATSTIWMAQKGKATIHAVTGTSQ